MNGDLVISYGGLSSASTSYTNASTKFSEATNSMINALVQTESSWKDASSADWQEKIAKAKTTFANVAAKLDNNAKVLTSINNAVSARSSNVQSAVSNM